MLEMVTLILVIGVPLILLGWFMLDLKPQILEGMLKGSIHFYNRSDGSIEKEDTYGKGSTHS